MVNILPQRARALLVKVKAGRDFLTRRDHSGFPWDLFHLKRRFLLVSWRLKVSRSIRVEIECFEVEVRFSH